MKFTSAAALSILIYSAIAVPILDERNENVERDLVARQKDYNWVQSANDGQSANTDMGVVTYAVPDCVGNDHETITHLQYGPYHAYPANTTVGSIQSIFLTRQINNNEQLDFFTSVGVNRNPLPAQNSVVPSECQYYMFSIPIATPNGCYNIGEVSPCWRFWLNPAYCSGGPDC